MLMRKYMFLLVLALFAMSAQATSFTYLNVTSNDSIARSLEAASLKITFDNGVATFTTADGVEHTATLADMAYMEFSNTKGADWDDTPLNPKDGDVNIDTFVDAIDLNILINILLGADQADNYDGRADLNSDGAVDGTDINMLINILLGR